MEGAGGFEPPTSSGRGLPPLMCPEVRYPVTLRPYNYVPTNSVTDSAFRAGLRDDCGTYRFNRARNRRDMQHGEEAALRAAFDG